MCKQQKLRSIHGASGGKCFYCNRRTWIKHIGQSGPAKKQATLDHLHVKSDGGTYARDNLVLACRRCNSLRGVLDWKKFKEHFNRGGHKAVIALHKKRNSDVRFRHRLRYLSVLAYI